MTMVAGIFAGAAAQRAHGVDWDLARPLCWVVEWWNSGFYCCGVVLLFFVCVLYLACGRNGEDADDKDVIRNISRNAVFGVWRLGFVLLVCIFCTYRFMYRLYRSIFGRQY